MPQPLDLVASDPESPPTTTVVIIGGGIIGVCTAFFLARDGIPVVLCEKGDIAAEQSSRNWGWCRKMGRDPREVPLAIEALRLWSNMNKLIDAESGFRRAGIVYLCRTEKDLAKRTEWWSRSAARSRSTAGCSPAINCPALLLASPATGREHSKRPVMGGRNRGMQRRRSRRRHGGMVRSC